MGNFIRGGPQVPVVLASLILWGSFAWGLPADAPVTEDEADVASAEGAWNCDRCGTANDASAKYCTECGAKRPTDAEAAVAAEDPWAGVKISDAYDELRCPYCGAYDELTAARCSTCGYEFPQPTGEYTYPPWVFVPGKGYYEEGTMLEPGKSRKGLWITGLVITGIGLPIMIGGLVISTAGGDPVGIPLSIAGSAVTVVGSILITKGFSTRTEAVYAFASGYGFEPYERPAFALRSADSEGVALKVEVTLLGF